MVIAADSHIGVPSWTIVGTNPLGLSFRKSGFSCSLLPSCNRRPFVKGAKGTSEIACSCCVIRYSPWCVRLSKLFLHSRLLRDVVNISRTVAQACGMGAGAQHKTRHSCKAGG